MVLVCLRVSMYPLYEVSDRAHHRKWNSITSLALYIPHCYNQAWPPVHEYSRCPFLHWLPLIQLRRCRLYSLPVMYTLVLVVILVPLFGCVWRSTIWKTYQHNPDLDSVVLFSCADCFYTDLLHTWLDTDENTLYIHPRRYVPYHNVSTRYTVDVRYYRINPWLMR